MISVMELGTYNKMLSKKKQVKIFNNTAGIFLQALQKSNNWSPL